MIRSRLKRLRLEKEEREGRKLTYRVISHETGLSPGVINRVIHSDFAQISTDTIDRLCAYFQCTVGELLEYVPDGPPKPRTGDLREVSAGSARTLTRHPND
jgi:Predicted transcriptional regulator